MPGVLEAQPSLSAFLPSSRKASVAPGGGGGGHWGERSSEREQKCCSGRAHSENSGICSGRFQTGDVT